MAGKRDHLIAWLRDIHAAEQHAEQETLGQKAQPEPSQALLDDSETSCLEATR